MTAEQSTRQNLQRKLLDDQRAKSMQRQFDAPTPAEDGSNSGQPSRSELLTSEDWWAVWIGAWLLVVCLAAVLVSRPDDFAERASRAHQAPSLVNPLKKWLAKPGDWIQNPVASIYRPAEKNAVAGLFGVFVLSLLSFGVGSAVMGESPVRFAGGFWYVFLLAMLAYVLAGQQVISNYNLEYALWALAIGLIISNTIGTPAFARPAVKTEFYIKTGLVILGAEVLFGRLLTLGVPGIFVAWMVTPIVLVATYAFGQRVLRVESKTLNVVISADMSVCGVSAAIATAAACRAKKEELSLAIGMSLTFTVIMMVLMPAIIRAVGMSEVLGGAWMGGTIDSTGAVAAAGGILGDNALKVAATVKMIQNILIGVIAFGVAVYWVTYVESSQQAARPNAMEIWYRFPKFVIGFVLASIVFSILHATLAGGEAIVDAVTRDSTKTLRGWFFCLAFVSIGLETNFRKLAGHLKGGKPLVLYFCGQTLNICLTLLMAWLMFEVIFSEAIQEFVG